MIGTRYPHRMTVFRPTGRDDNGNPAGVTTPNVPCRIDYRQQFIRIAGGEQKPSRATVETGHPVEAGDIVTLQGETSASAVIDVRRVDDLGGREKGREVYL